MLILAASLLQLLIAPNGIAHSLGATSVDRKQSASLVLGSECLHVFMSTLPAVTLGKITWTLASLAAVLQTGPLYA